MKKQGTGSLKRTTPIFTIALFVLMLGCILLLVVFGSSMYGAIVKNRDINSAKRASLSYITQRVRAKEEKGGIKIEKGPQGDALVLMELSEETGCETRIYLYEGELLEEYALSGSEFSPQDAQPIAKTSRFDIRIDNGELLVATAEGASYISLRTEEAFS